MPNANEYDFCATISARSFSKKKKVRLQLPSKEDM
jgi:hypothetical protein